MVRSSLVCLFLAGGLDVDRELDLLADEEAALGEGDVEAHAEVLAANLPGRLEPGDVVSCEPGSCTPDLNRGIRLENTFLIT
jgi:Xaa-Pro aminopeptidase